MSKKEIIKCDFCDREIHGSEGSYYELSSETVPGWCSYTGSINDFDTKRQMCSDCALQKGIAFKH